MTLEEQIQAEIDEEKKTSSKPIEVTPPLEDISIPVVSTESNLTQVKSKTPESEGVEPSTDVRGMTGAVIRGLTVPAAQALGGAVLGSPLGPPGMAAGAAAGPIVFGLGDLAVEGVNAYFGTDFGTSRGAITKLLDSLGTPKPDTAAERITEAVTEGLASGGGTAAGFKKAGEIAKTGSKLQKVSEFMGQKPLEQLAIGGAASLASSGSQEAGAGPVGSTLAGLGAAAAIPLTRGGYRAIFPTQEMKQERALERLRGVYQTILPEEAQRQQMVQQLRDAAKLGDQDVRLMTGDITGHPAILALQRAAEKSSQEVAQRSAENIAGIGKKISTGLEEVGAKPEEAAKIFEDQFNALKNQYQSSIQELQSQGLKATTELESAKSVLDQAEKDLANNKITAKQAYEEAKKTLDEAVDAEKSRQSDISRGETNVKAAQVIQAQKKAHSDYATSLYNEIQGVDPFKPETAINTIENLVPSGAVSKLERVSGKTPQELTTSQVELNPNIPTVVKRIYQNLVDKKGNKIPKELKDVMAELRQLNAAISTERNPAQQRIMMQVKKSLDEDLKQLETTYPQIKKANKFYAEQYADVFKSDAAKEAFEKGASLTQILDNYSGSKDDLIRLRKSIEGSGDVPVLPQHLENTGLGNKSELVKSGFNAIDDWILSRVEDVLKKPTSKGYTTSNSIKNWKNKEGSVILDAFKNSGSKAESEIDDLIKGFENLEDEAVNLKANSDKIASQEIQEGNLAKDAYNKARAEKQKIDQDISEKKRKLISDFREQKNSSLNPANRFIGGNAQEVIGNIMSNAQTSESNMAKILEKAAQDPTGKATEGVKNAARRWLDDYVRTKGLSTTTTGIADPVLQIQNLKASLGKLDELLKEVKPGVPSPKRQALETIFGKNSKELTALDRSRQVLDMVSRETTMSASDLVKGDVKSNEVIDALISVGAIQVANVKGYVAWKMIELMRKLGKTSEKDVKNIFENLLAKSLYDPETAEVAMKPVTKESWPATKRLARNLGIQARATDFGLEEEDKKEEQPKTKMGFGFASGGTFPKL